MDESNPKLNYKKITIFNVVNVYLDFQDSPGYGEGQYTLKQCSGALKECHLSAAANQIRAISKVRLPIEYSGDPSTGI